jgi:acetyl-CoA decarbonylase/synthase complex subunit gamma
LSLPDAGQPFVTGLIGTPNGLVPQVSTPTWKDGLGTVKARFGIGRMHYTVDPGLYALGQPGNGSPVLVTANYKMSFDSLRSALPGRDAWILVLDTKGINVWCAAGKGTFGTEELVRRVAASSLEKVVEHRELILPQLGAPGVAAHKVKKLSGFRVHYGPVRAADLPAYLDGGFSATPDMRRTTFTLAERIVLIPMEMLPALKATLLAVPLLLILSGLGSHGVFRSNVLNHGVFAVIAFLSAVFAGTVLAPVLLPALPGRSFSLKGILLGVAVALILALSRDAVAASWSARLETIAWFLIVPAVTAYLAMNFTGSSTFTSLSGVKKEMGWALPLEIGSGLAGFCVWLGSRFVV